MVILLTPTPSLKSPRGLWMPPKWKLSMRQDRGHIEAEAQAAEAIMISRSE